MFGTVFLSAALISAGIGPEVTIDSDATIRVADFEIVGRVPIDCWFKPTHPFVPGEVVYIKNMIFGSFFNAYFSGRYEDSTIAAIKNYSWSDMEIARKRVDNFFFRYDEPGSLLLDHFEDDPTAMLALYKFYTRTHNELQGAPGARSDAFKQKIDRAVQAIKISDYANYITMKPIDRFARRTILCMKLGWGKAAAQITPELDTLWDELTSSDLTDPDRLVLIHDLVVLLYVMGLGEWLYSNGVLDAMLQLAVDIGGLPKITFLTYPELNLDEKFCVHFVLALASMHSTGVASLTHTTGANDPRMEYYNKVLSEFCYAHREQLLSQADTIAPALHHHYNPDCTRFASLDDIARDAPANTFKDMPPMLVYLLFYFKGMESQGGDKDLLVRLSERLDGATLAVVLCHVGVEYYPNDTPESVLSAFVQEMDTATRRKLLAATRQQLPRAFQRIHMFTLSNKMQAVLKSLKYILRKSLGE
ncbi:hypothetical protein PAPHI01_2320 [Pancytospora philotis]|nr:hypothetical protein PAPHI01_2320 [Pancytospora philotis]